MFDYYDHLAPRFTPVCMAAPASASMPSTAFENGINEGQLYQWIRKYNIRSMSRKGNGYGNCIMETFFGRMKDEMYYENDRIQPKTKWMPPVKYREASIC